MQRGITLTIIAVLLVLSAGGGYWWWQQQPDEQLNPSNIEVSANETRVFKTLELKNGLRTVLVSDTESDKAAAALNVFSGSWANPADVQGLAHFLEHMLFLGTEKYPAVDGYQTFIEQNGGSDNAYTAPENTLYYFDISATELEPALDRFSQFFIAPLFDPEFSERERNAVHSEYSASLQNDGRRIGDVIRELVSPNHPQSQLAIGNLVTLNAPDMGDRLQSFFREHYVAGNMSLAIYGPQSIEELETFANTYFAGIRMIGDSEPEVYDQPIFEPSDLPMLVEIEPRRELRRLEFRFPIAGTANNITGKPYNYISRLLGHESTGSLLSLLKARGWAEDVSAGQGAFTKSNTTFNIAVTLTPEGLENWEEVAELVFSTIELLEREGIQPWIYEEANQINEIAFQFAEKVAAQSTAVSLAERLRHYPPEQLLVGPYRATEFNPADIAAAFEPLNPDNALVLLVHPGANTTQESEYYSTPYSSQPLRGNTVAAWRTPQTIAELAVPEANPFVPTDLTVAPLSREESILYQYDPQIIVQDENRTVWFEQDDAFKTPKSDIHLLLETPLFQNDVDALMATYLYLELVNDALNEVRYQATLAGSGYGINVADKGVQMRLYGYQNKLPLLLDTLVLELTEHTIVADRFRIKREELLRRLRNRDEDPVLNQVARRMSEWMLSDRFTVAQQIRSLESMTADSLINIRNQWMESAHMTMLIHGNLDEATALQLADRIDAVIPQQGSPATERQVAKLPKKNFLTTLTIDHSDAGFLQLYQGENSSLRERALYALLAEVMSAPYFAELRTKEQLGYIVLARAYPLDDLPHLLLYVQSPTTDPALLQLYSDRFLSRYGQEVNEMNDATFSAYKQGLITSLSEPDKNLFELSSRYWSNIQDGNQHFNTRKRIANEVEKISLDGFKRFYQNRLLSDDTRSLTLHQIGTDMDEDYQEHIQSIVGFYPIENARDWPDDVDWITPTFNNL